jgi:hypothetical protein
MNKLPFMLGLSLLLFFTCVFATAAEVVKSDVNKDGKPDGWTYVNNGNGEKQEMDINFDGNIDAVYVYEWGGKVKEEILDTDYDGRMDNWRTYEDGNLVEDQIDSDADGEVDIWFYIDRGMIIRLEIDTSGDGKPDLVSEF